MWWKGQGGGLGDLFRDCAVKSLQVWYHLFWNFPGSEVLREHVCQGLWVLLHQAAQCLEPPLCSCCHTHAGLCLILVCVCVSSFPSTPTLFSHYGFYFLSSCFECSSPFFAWFCLIFQLLDQTSLCQAWLSCTNPSWVLLS